MRICGVQSRRETRDREKHVSNITIVWCWLQGNSVYDTVFCYVCGCLGAFLHTFPTDRSPWPTEEDLSAWPY